jgi:hypothetical protein
MAFNNYRIFCIKLKLYVCMYYVCMRVSKFVSNYVCMSVCMCTCMHVCKCVCVCVCMYVCMYACMHACMYVSIYVCNYVRMYTSSSRADKPICTKLGMLIPWDQKENIGKSKHRKSVLSSSLGEGGSCSSETKNDRRTAAWLKLFVSKRRLQEQRPQYRETVLGSSLGDDLSVNNDWEEMQAFVEFTSINTAGALLVCMKEHRIS